MVNSTGGGYIDEEEIKESKDEENKDQAMDGEIKEKIGKRWMSNSVC